MREVRCRCHFGTIPSWCLATNSIRRGAGAGRTENHARSNYPLARQWTFSIFSGSLRRVELLLPTCSEGRRELFEEGWEDMLHREDGIMGRATNGHIDTVVDVKAM